MLSCSYLYINLHVIVSKLPDITYTETNVITFILVNIVFFLYSLRIIIQNLYIYVFLHSGSASAVGGTKHSGPTPDEGRKRLKADSDVELKRYH